MCDDKGPIIVNSARDRRTLEYLVEKCGIEAVEQACAQVAGQRRLYVSNIAKVLGVEIPDEVVITPRAEALVHLERLKKLLRKS
ncbi:cryptic plasmid protein A [Paraburkholderia sp. RL18-101-BIB-B]|uniref:cryptic plasmid protein A n=1 Tax=Paraburkholderia sp. RL18-101-BIB-B TaxID=3031634 RepID=UPI0038B9BC71